MMFVAYLVAIPLAFLALHRLYVGLRAWATLRGTRLVTCPATQETVAVEVSGGPLALGAAVGRPRFELRDCTLWPARAGCGAPCLAQIERAPADCMVRTLLQQFYAGRKCALCGRPFGEIHWHDHKPALRDPQGVTREWSAIAPETLPEVLKTYAPVCWNCHGAEWFRRTYPDRYIDVPPLH